LLQSYHKGSGFGQQIQEKWTSQLQAPIFTNWTKLDLCVKYNTTINSKEQILFWQTSSLWTCQEIPHHFRNHKLRLHTKRNIIINATEQSVSWKTIFFFLMSYFVLVLISKKRGCWWFIYSNIPTLFLCFFFWYFNRSGTHDFLTYCKFLLFIFIVKFLWVWVCGIYSHSLPNSLEINFSTTNSNQYHSQGNLYTF
jgi:hypothetical protein